MSNRAEQRAGALVEREDDLPSRVGIAVWHPARHQRPAVLALAPPGSHEEDVFGCQNADAVNGVAERRKVQAFEQRVIARPVADRRCPQTLPFVQINRRHPRVRRLEERQAVERGAVRGVLDRG